MSGKSSAVAARVARFNGRRLDARYLAYFDCFNQQQYYEAHDVLEDLWLLDRNGPDGAFYKGLIQLAGAFVLLQKNRPRAAVRVLHLADTNLRQFPARHRAIDLAPVLALVTECRLRIEQAPIVGDPLAATPPPVLAWPDESDPTA